MVKIKDEVKFGENFAKNIFGEDRETFVEKFRERAHIVNKRIDTNSFLAQGMLNINSMLYEQ